MKMYLQMTSLDLNMKMIVHEACYNENEGIEVFWNEITNIVNSIKSKKCELHIVTWDSKENTGETFAIFQNNKFVHPNSIPGIFRKRYSRLVMETKLNVKE